MSILSSMLPDTSKTKIMSSLLVGSSSLKAIKLELLKSGGLSKITVLFRLWDKRVLVFDYDYVGSFAQNHRAREEGSSVPVRQVDDIEATG